jgi:hypothetical protein
MVTVLRLSIGLEIGERISRLGPLFCNSNVSADNGNKNLQLYLGAGQESNQK